MPVPADVTGGVILVEHLQIRDLSRSGVCFTCTRRLNPGQGVDLELRKGTTRLKLKGTVVRSSFQGVIQFRGEDRSSYEVAVAFQVSSDVGVQLDDFVALLQRNGP